MRRQFALAFGGILAAAAVGTAQQPVPAKKPDSSFVRPAGPTMMLPPAEAVPVAGGYTQVQPVQTYTVGQTGAPVQYIAVQPAAPPATTPAMTPAIQYVPTQAVTAPSTSAVMAAPMQPAAANSAPALITTGATSASGSGSANACPTGACPSGICQTGACLTNNGGGGCATGNCASAADMNPCSACTTAPVCQQPPCGPYGRMWVSAEYLLWWTRGMSVPPLVTGGPAGTPRELAGVLGDPNTRILFGDTQLNDGVRSGFRVRFGGWLDCCQTCGVEGSYFFLSDSNDNYSADCTDQTVIARPFTNIRPRSGYPDGYGYPDSELVCYPGVVNGTIAVNSGTSLQGFDVNARKNLSCDCCNRIDALVGFRYLQLDDSLTIFEDLTTEGGPSTNPIPGGVAPGTRFQLYDSFQTRNEFYGGQVGLAGEHRRGGGFYLGWRFLVGLGTTHKEATIDGSTTITPSGGRSTTYAGGLLALPTNIGRYTKNDFSVVPEIGLNLGYQFNQNIRVFVGYSFLYWSNVTRAGDIIDLTINTSQLPPNPLVGPARPAFTWNDSDFWAQGVSFGAELRY